MSWPTAVMLLPVWFCMSLVAALVFTGRRQ